MPKKTVTFEEFVERSKKVHGDKYEYDPATYAGTQKKTRIICPKHGEFWQPPSNHMSGRGCKECNSSGKNKAGKFIERAHKKYGDKFDYSKVGEDYVDYKSPVSIICPEHGEFKQSPYCHMMAKLGCPRCSHKYGVREDMKCKEDFVRYANETHNNKYNYSEAEFNGSYEKLKIICPIHGEFWQTPNAHVKGTGCPECGKLKKVEKSTKTLEHFIEVSRKVHGDRYDYSQSKYVNALTKIKIICKEHGPFWQTSSQHFAGQGCPKCGGTKKLTKEEFIDAARKIHGDKYDYSKVEYTNMHAKVEIICPIHGSFFQMPYKHLQEHGCDHCNESHAERDVLNLLKNNGIRFERQKRFPWMGMKELDFYLPDYNVAIECQGDQHYIPVDCWGGEEMFEKVKQRDADKLRECTENGVRMLYYGEERVLKYDETLITDSDILLTEIKKYRPKLGQAVLFY